MKRLAISHQPRPQHYHRERIQRIIVGNGLPIRNQSLTLSSKTVEKSIYYLYVSDPQSKAQYPNEIHELYSIYLPL